MKNSTDRSINKRLKAYSAVAGSFLISGNVANASIVYTDVNPDTVVTQIYDGKQSYNIDLNSDGINDFNIEITKGTFYGTPYAYVTAFGLNTGNSFLSTSSNGYPDALNVNKAISSTAGTWSGNGYLAGKFGTQNGNFFFDATRNKYLGVRFTIGANTTQYYYGWIRISVSSNGNTFTVYDFAYETTVDATTMKTPILAGLTTNSTVTGITDNSASSGGKVLSNGGVPILERGVCWSEHSPPTIADNRTSDGASTGSFTSAITGLKPGTTYYVRAYATTIAGTAYGSIVTFKTTGVAGINNALSANTIIKNINNVLTVDFLNSVQGKMDLVNISGTVVKSADFNGSTWELNLQDMMEGIYIVRIANNEGYLVKKILVY
jgi:Secretion system C-terminal sorting domain